MIPQSIYKTPAGEQAVMALYDAALARWPVPYETLTIPTRHGDTFVIASGVPDAPPLILLHGAATNSATWAGDVADYSRQHRVYAVDLLGEAGRSAPNRPAWDGPAYAEWLDDVLAALRVESAALVGLSQGGWTALKYAVFQPARVNRLVLLTPGGIVPDRLSFIALALGTSILGRRGTRYMLRRLYATQPIPDGFEEIMVVVMRHFKPRIGALPTASDDELRRLTMPVLLLGGSEDAVRDLDRIAARLRRFVPQLDIAIIPGAGHALMNTTGRVLAFLTAHQPVLARE